MAKFEKERGTPALKIYDYPRYSNAYYYLNEVGTSNIQNIVITPYMSVLSTPATMEGLFYVKFFIRKFNISFIGCIP